MATDIMPIVIIGGLAIGGFLLFQSGMLSSLFPAPVVQQTSNVSGASSTTATTASPCMGTDPVGNPCACPTTAAAMALAYDTTAVGCYRNKGVLVCPNVGTQVPGEGFFPATTDCVSCQQTYGGNCMSCQGPLAGTASCINCMQKCGDITGRVCGHGVGQQRGRGGGSIIGVIPGSINVIPGSSVLGSTIGSSCDCSKCGGSASPSLGSSASDLNNFIGSSIAQAGYGF